MWSTSQAEIAAAETLAEFTYRNQMLERHRTKPVSNLLARFGANWPCMWGEEFTGAPLSALANEKSPGGWRSTSGLRKLADPCVVYSLRSHPAYDGGGNLAFEAGVLATRPSCEVHIFAAARDGDVEELAMGKWAAWKKLGEVITAQSFYNIGLPTRPAERAEAEAPPQPAAAGMGDWREWKDSIEVVGSG